MYFVFPTAMIVRWTTNKKTYVNKSTAAWIHYNRLESMQLVTCREGKNKKGSREGKRSSSEGA